MTIDITLPDNPYLSIALGFVVVVIVVRIVRWVLDILP